MEILKIASVFAGAVLGAGFASGQEIMIFFSRFGKWGVLGALFSGTLIMLFGGIICALGFDMPKKDYFCFLSKIYSAPLSKAVYVVTQIFLYISFCIMISGSAELLNIQFNIPKIAGEMLALVICAWCLLGNVSGVAKFNLYIAPIMVLGISAVSVISVFFLRDAQPVISEEKHSAFINACLYMSYNMLTSAAVLVPVTSLAKNRKEAMLGGIIGGGGLCAVLTLTAAALSMHGDINVGSEFPMLLLSKKISVVFGCLYPTLIYMAMLTTAVSSGFCAAELVKSMGFGYKTAVFAVCAFAVPLSLIQFSTLVKNCYIFFGVLGLLLIAGIVLKIMKNKEK